ncbi:MAG TPA: hypothetical protein VEK11_25500 [Thermoanaerobaculia bacterium]|nr:hypothetical protein [Thermoanaerobaculia bacterium]
MASLVSDTLERFIRERLPSVEQIEIVLLLRREMARAWSAPEVSSNLGTPPESTAMRLFLLASNGVVTFDGTGGVPKYRYVTTDPAVDAMIEEMARAYAQDREGLLEIVGAQPRDPLRSFADAFKLKK